LVRAAVVDQQAVEGVHPDVSVPGGDRGEHLHPLLHGEQAGFGFVDQDRDDDLVVELAGPTDDVEMTLGHGVERTRADSAPHGACTYQSVVSPYRRNFADFSGAGHTGSAAVRRRSTTTTAPGASHPLPARSASTASTSASGSWYGGSAKTRSNGGPGGEAAT